MVGRVKARAQGWWESVRPLSLKDDAIAGLPRAAASVPDGMAAASLAGVNPIYGLYASFAGPLVGGLTQSTKLMVITTTSAAALATASALEGVPAADRVGALFLLTVIAGAIMLAAGLFGLGRLRAFVSHSVMTGFLTGVAINITLSQIPKLTGAEVSAPNSLRQAIEVARDPVSLHLPSLLIGLAALVLLVAIPATPLRRYAALVALFVPTLFVQFVPYFNDVAVVADVGDILRGLPLPALPQLSHFSLSLVAGAFAVAVIVLVQGAGVSESVPNPDKSRSDANQDFVSQGWANIITGLFQGMPVGGSVSQTALNLSVGARGRWASIMSGVWMLAILVAFSGLVELVAMPTLAAVLIVASIGSIKPGEVVTVWRSGASSQIAMGTTFLSTLFLPVAAAVGVGAALSLLLSVNREAQDVQLMEVTRDPDGRFREREAPATLPGGRVTVFHVYGSLFYAGARTLEEELPLPDGTPKPVAVLRIRGRTMMGATAFTVLSRYAKNLDDFGGRLYLSGVAPELVHQFSASGRITASDPLEVIEATDVMGESTVAAYEEGMAFLLGEAPEESAATQRDSWINRTTRWTRTMITRSDDS
ncbi:MAG: SulP family inorganic anion transporter [Actinomycetota bacterium]